MTSELMIFIGCDADPDRKINNNSGIEMHKKFVWDGIETGIPKLKGVMDEFEDINKKKVKITWFLRADEQMNIVYGDYSWSVKHFLDLWRTLKSEGHGIGWHPHLWQWHEKHKIWFQEMNDQNWIRKCFENGYKDISKMFNIKTARMGWNFHSDFTMRILNDLGILADFSGIPGLKNLKKIDETGLPAKNQDWEISPSAPYLPSEKDYRRPRRLNEKALNIIEVPQTTFKLPISVYAARFLRNLLRLRITLDRISEAYITKDPRFLRNAIRTSFKKSKKTNEAVLFSAFFHPDELLPERGFFSLENFKINLESIAETSKKYNVPTTFLTAEEVINQIKIN